MALTKEDLGQIKKAVVEAVVSESIKKVLKETVLEVVEPMMAGIKKEIEDLAITTKHGFDGVDTQFNEIGERIDKMNDRIVDLDKTNTQAHEDMALKLDNVAYRFELTDLKKRVEVLEKKAMVRV